MKVRILGCGTSTGVPRIGNDWGRCDPAEPRNRRRRPAILVNADETRVLVDTGPDLREQLLDADVATISAVIWTHEHADHVHGLDDLRQLFHNGGAPVPGYASHATLESLRRRFDYAFEGRGGYPPTIQSNIFGDPLRLGSIEVAAVEQPHGWTVSTGLLFKCDNRKVGYSTDCNNLTDEMKALFQGVDLWIVDALRREPHPSHNHLDRALSHIDRVQPKRAILTHMDNSMDYRSLLAELPPHIEPGYDGMEIDL